MKVCKYIVLLVAVFLIVACEQKAAKSTDQEVADAPDTTDASTISPEQLISPGLSIGQIKLDGNLADAIKLLGKPDGGDAAMGSALATWYANHDTTGYRTSIFASRTMGGADENIQHIKKILVTSPWFKTADFISTGNNRQDIAKFYTLKEGNSYTAGGQKIKTYSDIPKGISFEIDAQGKCVGILVHQPNSTAGTYLDMH
ncbi:hypothetical protein A0256_04635 [Mucilaginibacter sp. PAMC 26640]|nr:hypothetical protein A0256_04635 [Mucilaginibacter sp. PAMC 26640]